MSIIISIAVGGGIGAVGRYLVMEGVNSWLGQDFPYSTLIVNVVGSFVIGLLFGALAVTWSPSAELRGFLIIGFLGSFTTFSAFSLDVITLMQQGEFLSALLYIIVSVIFSVLALFAGISTIRYFLA
jgi:CrcB protein